MKLKKSLGQHFLHDKNIAAKIVRLAQVGPEDNVLEIGPGKGILSKALLEKSNKVIAYEIDKDFSHLLAQAISSPNFEIINQDFLQSDLAGLQPDSPWKVVANIPYKITSPLLFRLVENRELFSTITLMLQKEVADRLSAQPGNKVYGRITVKVNIHYEVKKLFKVAPTVFYPQPRVSSAVVKLMPKRQIPQIKQPQLLHKIIDKSFQHRRKMLRTSLKFLFSQPEIKRISSIDFDLRKRPEKLSAPEFIHLSNLISKKLKQN